MSEKIEKIIKELETLEFLEASKLVRRIEEVFGVDSSLNNNVVVSAPVAINTEPVAIEEEKTEFDIILEKIPTDKKIAILKIVRSLTGLGLKEAKAIVDTVPQTIRQGVNKDEAEKIKKELEDNGAQVILK